MSTVHRLRRTRSERVEQKRQSAHYLTFTAAGRVFGIRIAAVHEVLEYEPPMEVPLLPAFVRGITDLRGTAIPVVDLTRRLTGHSGPVARTTSIVITEVIVHDIPVLMGILVDAVLDVLEIDDASVEPRPDFGDAVHTEFMQGITRNLDGSLLVLLDANHLFTGDDLSALLAVNAEQPVAMEVAP